MLVAVSKNAKSLHEKGALLLDGDPSSVTMKVVAVNGKTLSEGEDYTLTPTQLIIHEVRYSES